MENSDISKNTLACRHVGVRRHDVGLSPDAILNLQSPKGPSHLCKIQHDLDIFGTEKVPQNPVSWVFGPADHRCHCGPVVSAPNSFLAPSATRHLAFLLHRLSPFCTHEAKFTQICRTFTYRYLAGRGCVLCWCGNVVEQLEMSRSLTNWRLLCPCLLSFLFQNVQRSADKLCKWGHESGASLPQIRPLQTVLWHNLGCNTHIFVISIWKYWYDVSKSRKN